MRQRRIGRRPPRAVAVALLSVAVLGGSTPAPAPGFGLRDAAGRWRALTADDRAGHAEDALAWSVVSPGVEVARTVGGRPDGWQTELVVVRVDPSRVALGLELATRRGGLRGDWTVTDRVAGASAPEVLAVNAGQFEGGRPWGWLVLDGRERQAPGTGSLTMAVVVDDGGRVNLVPTDEISTWRDRPGVRWAFQSYPMLLAGGRIPRELGGEGQGIDLGHRDIRLALGRTPDGRIMIVLTRYRPLAGRSLPWGPTVPETAWLMRALGAVDAVMLDGGLSAQLAYDEGGRWTEWPAGRRVPLGLVGVLPPSSVSSR